MSRFQRERSVPDSRLAKSDSVRSKGRLSSRAEQSRARLGDGNDADEPGSVASEAESRLAIVPWDPTKIPCVQQLGAP